MSLLVLEPCAEVVVDGNDVAVEERERVARRPVAAPCPSTFSAAPPAAPLALDAAVVEGDDAPVAPPAAAVPAFGESTALAALGAALEAAEEARDRTAAGAVRTELAALPLREGVTVSVVDEEDGGGGGSASRSQPVPA